MPTDTQSERLVESIRHATFEAISLEDCRETILPQLSQLFAAEQTLLYSRDECGQLQAIGGNMADFMPDYAPYYSEDPLQTAFARINPRVKAASDLREWRTYLQHPVYTDCMRGFGVHDFLSLRFTNTRHAEPGMVGMLMARDPRQPAFGKTEYRLAERILPPLEALVRRSLRLERQLHLHGIAETILDEWRRPLMLFSPRGAPLWISRRADSLLGLMQGKRTIIPEPLAGAVWRMGQLLKKNADTTLPPSAIALETRSGRTIRAELRVAQGPNGHTCVFVELEDCTSPPFLDDTAASFRLTKAEKKVLHLIALGLSNKEIAERLFVAPATVHTHVARVLNKLGVQSRVQAALIAHGHQPAAQTV